MVFQNLLYFLFPFVFLQHFALCQEQVVRSAYWLSSFNFSASEIESKYFTHIFCAFADINPKDFQVSISSSNISPFSTFTKNVQQKNPSIKTLLSIKDSNFVTFSTMASNPTSRKQFIDSSIFLARSFNFHGLDLYWTYPKSNSDMINLEILIKEWQSAIILEAKTSSKQALLLSLAVYYKPKINGTLNYPSKSLARSLDWINLMAYNFTSPNLSRVMRPHAALLDQDSGKNISGSAGIEDWIKSGIPSKKIVFGLPFFGYGWRLLNRENHDLNAPARGPIGGGDGSMGYKEISEFCVRATITFDADIVGNYCYLGTTWINFDEFNTIFTKVAYVKKKGLLGYFAWHVGVDNKWTLSQEALQAWEV
ncbi:class V chitinase-like [Nicotiana tabacum]|uniref:Chitotriosidase-1-like n=1 Tax=Nicotiana tabacum TaxID=4097 RepID=A0A1S3ZQM6_TOBAC|nr:PREDICTED: chitotriosidase-1-like [Nicotiana tabacum]